MNTAIGSAQGDVRAPATPRRTKNALKRALMGLSLVLATLTPGTPTALAVDAEAGTPTESLSDEAAAIHFRETFGFPADLGLVRNAARDKVSYPNDDFGVPLTQEEAAEMHRRMGVQWAMNSAMDYGNSQPQFAGAFIDQKAGGVPVFLFTGDLDSHRSNIEKSLEQPIDFRVEMAKRSMSELLAQQEVIEARRQNLKVAGTPVVETAIRTDINAVVVGIDGLSAGRKASVTAVGGAGLVFENSKPAHSDACTNGNNCPPIKGGIAITAASGPGCTSGFIVKQSGTSTLRVLTAGHCLDVAGDVGVDWLHDGVKFGDAMNDTWQPGYVRTADVGLISILAAQRALMTTDNIMHGGNGRLYAVVGQHNGSAQAVGMTACRYGRTGGYKCGAINALFANRESCVGVRPNETCVTVTKTIRANFDSLGGDSGGPWWYYKNLEPGIGAIALGTHVHSSYEETPYQDPTPWHSWYSPIDIGATQYLANWDITYTLCRTDPC